MKFSTVQFATIASTLLSKALADIVYVTKTNQVIEYATITAGGEQEAYTTSSVVESIETGVSLPYTWVFSTNVLGQDIVFTSVISNDVNQAYRTLYEEHVIVQQGDYLSTQTLIVQANPTTLATSTLNSSSIQSSSVEGTAIAAKSTSQQAEIPTAIDSTSSSSDVAPILTIEPTTTSIASTSSAQETTPSTTSTQSSSTSSSSSSDSDFGDVQDVSFAKAILDAHNEKRAIHGAPALKWEQSAYDYAQAYADQYDCSGNLKHSGGKYGENLAVGYSDGPKALEAW
ncbi:unnamed protein product [Candida verbasci]|uniref:SCP domain-containing protein n=1 Tax=Candida verbasci TaxID=1227364 RepID=A0A9W4TVE2_9ASCO|nr:unnamed protein product [Candida verbasci]